MLSVVRVILAILVSVVIQPVDGNQRTVLVSDSISDCNEKPIISDDSDRVSSSSSCCEYRNRFCNSLDHALANLTSNVRINITTDVTLSVFIKRTSNLENVSIIGHNNPTVNCENSGAIYFDFCRNCVIQDITWNGCGTDTEAGIRLGDSFNIVIKNCSFQYSRGQAVAL